MRKLFRPLLLLLILFLSATPVYADAGVPMLFVTMPMMIVGLIPIILIEAYVLIKEINISLGESLKTSFIMNILSTLVGIPITWVALVFISMVTGGGRAYGIQTILQKFLAVTWQAPWLVPYESDLYWMVPAATLVLLVPFFFISYLVELFIAKKLEKRIDSIVISKGVFLANIASYSILFILALVWLIISIIKGK
jgi:hypothetical protein